MVILAYSFRLESADQVPDARTAARTILAQSHTSRLTPSLKIKKGAERISTPPTKSSGEQQWPSVV